ncbi:MAG: sulfopyruvate decarboxylase subunit alpha [Candidatus Lokiarchaeota archaeon]|nr:sulfopyruvate decarboxylase subunit alpha [Candidatus Lokiarchaeota archaeon]
MIDSKDFLNLLKEKGFSFASGVPCSYFSRLIDALSVSEDIRYIPATREDEATGIASGLALGKELAFVIMQNSGFATIGDALTSLAQLYKLPILLIVSYRGLEPDRTFPEHSLMGEVMEDSLHCYRVPYWNLTAQSWQATVDTAVSKMRETSMPVALMVEQGVL